MADGEDSDLVSSLSSHIRELPVEMGEIILRELARSTLFRALIAMTCKRHCAARAKPPQGYVSYLAAFRFIVAIVQADSLALFKWLLAPYPVNMQQLCGWDDVALKKTRAAAHKTLVGIDYFLPFPVVTPAAALEFYHRQCRELREFHGGLTFAYVVVAAGGSPRLYAEFSRRLLHWQEKEGPARLGRSTLADYYPQFDLTNTLKMAIQGNNLSLVKELFPRLTRIREREHLLRWCAELLLRVPAKLCAPLARSSALDRPRPDLLRFVLDQCGTEAETSDEEEKREASERRLLDDFFLLACASGNLASVTAWLESEVNLTRWHLAFNNVHRLAKILAHSPTSSFFDDLLLFLPKLDVIKPLLSSLEALVLAYACQYGRMPLVRHLLYTRHVHALVLSGELRREAFLSLSMFGAAEDLHWLLPDQEQLSVVQDEAVDYMNQMEAHGRQFYEQARLVEEGGPIASAGCLGGSACRHLHPLATAALTEFGGLSALLPSGFPVGNVLNAI